MTKPPGVYRVAFCLRQYIYLKRGYKLPADGLPSFISAMGPQLQPIRGDITRHQQYFRLSGFGALVSPMNFALLSRIKLYALFSRNTQRRFSQSHKSGGWPDAGLIEPTDPKIGSATRKARFAID